MKTKPNENAFPEYLGDKGLTKREYFAALAMQSFIAGVRANGCSVNIPEICSSSVWTADALINELNKEDGKE